MSSVNKIEELLLEVSENNDLKLYSEILELLGTIPSPIPQNIKEGICLIIENWQLTPNDHPEITEFLINVTKYFKQDFQELRSSLPAIIKKTLPASFNKTTSIKAIGVRDTLTPLYEVYTNYLKLKTLTESRLFFSNVSNNWGKTVDIDWIAGAIKLENINGTESTEVDLGIALKLILFFEETPELIELVKKKQIISFSKAKKLLSKCCATELQEEDIRNSLFFIYIPEKMTPAEFERWKEGKTEENDSISIEDARSLQELHQILLQDKELKNISEQQLNKIKIVLSLIRPSSAFSDYILWVEIVCHLLKLLSPEQMKSLIPSSNKEILDSIWPLDFRQNIPGIKIWTELKIVTLNSWAELTKLIKGEDYLVELCSNLPWKAWPTIISKIDKDGFIGILNSSKRLSSPEALLWIWKNKTSLPESLIKKINPVNLFASFGRKKDGAIWNTAIKELKKLIIENPEFQLSLIEDKESESHIIDFLERLNNLTSFTKNEKQSIIVKLSRQFPAMKDLFNTGKAKQVLSTQPDEEEDIAASDDEQHITSQKSYNAKIAELEEIINLHMPENTKAIATAREHGDLRENAEYAAAKERQKYLSEHRSMLESGIMTTVPTDFSEVKVEERIIAGCTVLLNMDNGKEETYHILGAWDSDPAKKYVSYDTGLGKVLVGKKVNENVTLPDGKKCTIKKISPLNDKIKSDLV